MKKIIVLGIVFLILVIVCSVYAEQKVNFKGYGIETWTDNDKLTAKTDNGEFTVIILQKEFTREESFAFHCWDSILNIPLSSDMEINEKIKAVSAIHLFIEVLAAQIKTGEINCKDVSIGFKDIGKALNVFWKMSFVAADRLVGNNDGYCSDAEIYKLRMSLQSRVVSMMTKTYLK